MSSKTVDNVKVFKFRRFREECRLRLSVTAMSTILAVGNSAGKSIVAVGEPLLYARCQEFAGRISYTFSIVYREPETIDVSGNNGWGTKCIK
jgi:hypothetical protein